ncbi:MAG: sugar ABC transporter permease [Anaerolineae bacterium]|nr:sugar ABC transporter permease [Anaerolineae bacterium]
MQFTKSKDIKVGLRRHLIGWMFLLPAILIYALFLLIPIGETILLSFFEWDGLNQPIFIGLANYERLFTDRYFWLSLGHTLTWMVLGVLLTVGMAMMLAVLVEDGKVRGRQFFRYIFFIPHIMSIAVAARIWTALYEPSYGLINSVLNLLGLESQARIWLGDPQVALPAIIVAWAWHLFGFLFVLYVAGLQGLNRELYDAAHVDGANGLQVFWHVTLPSLNRVHTMVLSLAIIASLNPFGVVRTMTGGGPFYATEVLPSLLYEQGLVQNRLGYASTTGVILAIMTFVITLVFIRLREHVEES